MLTEQAIAIVIFLILLAISIVGYVLASREGDRLDRQRQAQIGRDDPRFPVGPA